MSLELTYDSSTSCPLHPWQISSWAEGPFGEVVVRAVGAEARVGREARRTERVGGLRLVAEVAAAPPETQNKFIYIFCFNLISFIVRSRELAEYRQRNQNASCLLQVFSF